MKVRPFRFFARLVACTAPVAFGAGCGSVGSGDFTGEVGTYEPDGGSFSGSGDASGSGPLDAHIEDNHVTVTFVTLSCTGPCADVVAVPTGGHAPYTFKWNDGATSATRHVCPTSTTNYVVAVTDTGTSGEIVQPAQTVQVPLRANVLACPDGGHGPPPAADGGLCIDNPSFEGTATVSGFDAQPWVDCAPAFANKQEIVNASLSVIGQQWPSPSPTDGKTYLLLGTNGGVGYQAVSEPLCAVWRAGTSYSLKINLASPSNADGGLNTALAVPASLQIVGGSTSCAQGPVMWTSPTPTPTWTTYCATFTPTQDTSYLTLAVTGPTSPSNDPGYLYVDHLVPVAACP